MNEINQYTEDRPIEQQPPIQAGKQLMKGAGMLLAFSVLAPVAHGITKAISAKAGAYTSSWLSGMTESAGSSAVKRSVVDALKSKATTVAGEISFGKLAKELFTPESAKNILSSANATLKAHSDQVARSVAAKGVAPSLIGAAEKLESAKTFFRGSKREVGLRVLGKAAKYAGEYAATAPGYYLVDKFTGVFTKKEEKTPLWKMPYDYAKWNVSFLPMDIGFRAVSKAGGLAKAGSLLGLYYKSRNTEDIAKFALGVKRGAEYLGSFAGRLSSTVGSVKKGLEDSSWLKDRANKNSFTQRVVSNVAVSLREGKKAWTKPRQNFRVESNFDKRLKAIYDTEFSNRMGSSAQVLAARFENYARTKKELKSSFLDALLGGRNQAIEKADLKNFLAKKTGSSDKRFMNEVVKNIYTFKQKTGEELYLKNHYTIGNKSYDFGIFTTDSVRNNLAQLAKAKISIFNPLGYLGIGKRRYDAYPFQFFNFQDLVKKDSFEFDEGSYIPIGDLERSFDLEGLKKKRYSKNKDRAKDFYKQIKDHYSRSANDKGILFKVPNKEQFRTVYSSGKINLISNSGVRVQSTESFRAVSSYINKQAEEMYFYQFNKDAISQARNTRINTYLDERKIKRKSFRGWFEQAKLGILGSLESNGWTAGPLKAYNSLANPNSNYKMFESGGVFSKVLNNSEFVFNGKKYKYGSEQYEEVAKYVLNTAQRVTGARERGAFHDLPVGWSNFSNKFLEKPVLRKLSSTFNFDFEEAIHNPEFAATEFSKLAREKEAKDFFLESSHKASRAIIEGGVNISTGQGLTRSELLSIDILRYKLYKAQTGTNSVELSSILQGTSVFSSQEMNQIKALDFFNKNYDSIKNLHDIRGKVGKLGKELKNLNKGGTGFGFQDALDATMKSKGLVQDMYKGFDEVGHTLPIAPVIPKSYTSSKMEMFFPSGVSSMQGLVARAGVSRLAKSLFLNTSQYSHAGDMFVRGVLGKRVLPMAGAALAWRTLDTFFDENPMFSGTMLDEGLNVFAGEQIAKGRIYTSHMLDAIGVTSASKYLEGLMPGSVNSPMSRAARAIGLPLAGMLIGSAKGGVSGTKAGTLLGLAASAITGFGFADLTRTPEELVEIYSGREEVPVYKNRGWLLGKSPFGGDRISYFRPSWFARLKAQHKYNPVNYGSKTEALLFRDLPMGIPNPVAALFDENHYDRKSFYTRPYPLSGGFGGEVPIVGPTIEAVLSGILKAPTEMHKEEMASKVTDSNLVGSATYGLPGGQAVPGQAVSSPYSNRQTLSRQFYRGAVEPLGLFGWASSAIAGGQLGPFVNKQELATSAAKTSFSREFWEMQLGDMGPAGEGFRRLYPRQLKEIEQINPLRNRLADWLPEDIKMGDAYAKFDEGLLRLPGPGRESMYDYKETYPIRGSTFGKGIKDIVSYMLNINPPMTADVEETTEEGTALHRHIQNQLMRANLAVAVESKIYDPYRDLSGTVDSIIRDSYGKSILEIKTKSTEDLAKLKGPIDANVGQINAYMKMTGIKSGYLMYVSRENPDLIKTFKLNYSPKRWLDDVNKLETARSIARQLRPTISSTFGTSYSHLDRLSVLNNVSPGSEEFRNEMMMAQKQYKAGLLDEDDVVKLEKIQKQHQSVMRQYQMYPKRFDGTVSELMKLPFSPKSAWQGLTNPDTSYNLLSENTNIKAESEYNLIERVIGEGFEKFQTAMTMTPARKFFNYQSPYEKYMNTRFYGNESQNWETPIRSYVTPYVQGGLGSKNPFAGAIRWGQAGSLIGGAGGAIIGSAFGAAYGAAAYGANKLGFNYTPGEVDSERRINDAFDNLTFAKNQQLYQTTGNPEYLEQAMNTMTAMGQSKSFSMKQLLKASQKQEKPFILGFANTTDPKERQKILRALPKETGTALKAVWSQGMYQSSYSAPDLSSPSLYAEVDNSNLMSPQVALEDVKLQTIKQEGLDKHDFGLGFTAQENRIANSPFAVPALNMTKNDQTEDAGINLSRFDLQSGLQDILHQHGVNGKVNVSIVPGPGNVANLNINFTYNRMNELIQEQRNNSRYIGM